MNAYLETWSRAWAGWALAASWQIAVLIVLVAIAAFLSRRLSARFRYLLWMLVIIKALTPPSLGTAWSIGNWATPNWGRVSVTIAAEPRLGVPPSGGIPSPGLGVPPSGGIPDPGLGVPPSGGIPTSAVVTNQITITSILLLVWLAGFVVLASFILFRYWRLTQALLGATEADEGPLRIMLEKLSLRLNRTNPPDLLLSDAVTSPFLFGLLKPRIVLPVDLPNQLSNGQLEDVLLHELIHWRRRDLLAGWLQILVQALFWFHPFVWFAGAQLRHERECACDEAALESGCSQARRYGESLLKVLLAARGRSAVAMGFLGIFERNTRLQSRLEEIMNQETRVRRLKWWGWVSLAVFAILCLPMAALSQNGAGRGVGFTPLHMAAQNGHLGTVKLLIEKGADVNARSETGLTPLHLAAQGGHQDTAEALIKAGADINAKDNSGNTALAFASEKGHQQLAEMLINKGAEVNPKWTSRLDHNTNESVKLGYVPDSSDDKRSLGASGHAVIFERPSNARFLESVSIYAARYGEEEPPQMDFHLYVLNDKYQVVSDVRFPYSIVPHGPMRWIELPTPSIEVPDRFVIALAFNPDQRKGVYLGLASGSRENPHSVVGTPGNGFEPMDKPCEWMVRATLSDKPSGKEGIRRLADWKTPVETNPFKGLDSVHYDDGNVSDENKQSYGGRGPAISYNLGEFDLLTKGSYDKLYLKGFRLYAGRYGSGYDPDATKVKVVVLDSANAVRWQGDFPYSLFKYKSGWVDLPLSKPVPASSLMKEDRTITIAFDPEATQYKGIYFHYTKNPKSSHSSAGKVATGFKPIEDREWAVRAYFTNEETTPTSAPVISSSAGDTEWVNKLTNNQRLFMQWTDQQFDRFLDRRDFSKWQQVDRDELYRKTMSAIGGPQTRDYYEAVNTLGAIGDRRAVPALLKIATDRVGRDCRDNWMAARALGLIGDASAVSDLIHLSYHTNTNVHFWAQISLVRLTGQNFGYDWKKWGEWWNAQGGQPPFTPEKIRWWDDPKFEEASTADALAKADNEFLNKYFPGQVSAPPTAGTPSAMPSSAAVSKKAAWSALQATGEPDTNQAGDIPTAWASLDPDMGEQWLELDFANPPSIATMVRIHETFNPGAVTKVILKNISGSVETILTEIPVDDKTAAAPAFLEVPIQGKYAPNRVRIVLDTNKVHGWNEIDAVELVGADRRVWAGDARASSSYADRMARTGASNHTTIGKPNWSALQATGAPDTMQAGDIPTAWASYETDMGEQWLELDYNPPLRANKVRIHETYNPGAVTRVIVKENSSPSAKVLADVSVNDKTTQAPAFLEVPFETTASPVGCVRIVLDTNKVHGWNEIDAVELVGPDGRAWATDARASSSYADRFSSQATPTPAPAEHRGAPAKYTLSPAEQKLLNENQAAYLCWTEQDFANILDQSSFANARNKAELEQKWIATLQGPESKDYYEAINGLVAIKSKNAQPALLKVAAERVEKDNRCRWMAVRALGLVGDKSCVPELIHLTYHYNQNTRFWAQISLARLTGQNFATDWKKWGEWWNKQGGQPPFDPTPVQWAQSAEMREYMDPAKQREADAGVAEAFKQESSAPQILSITPSIGQTGVDPDAIREIVITFDRDMSSGFSWTGGGPDFPQSRNNQPAFWRDKRTCVKPVTLEAGKYYRLGINSSGHHNFKSVDGVPVEPVSVYFTTKGAAPELVAKMQKPQVVSMNPPNGATDVDPNTTEMRITFNVPMGGGFSWCGGGENYPETTAGARWSDDRKTCTLPVKLKPGWEYNVYLNSVSFQNFMSESGIPLEPVEYSFKTKAK